MNLADCYRLLGLNAGAPLTEIKASYRRLARRYHPDMNSGDQQAQEKFIQITEAYRILLRVTTEVNSPSISSDRPQPSQTSSPPKVTRKPVTVQSNPNLSLVEQQLKVDAYQQLQQLLRDHRFPRAIALVEGLAQRLPQDTEVRQWQAITYQRFGRFLIEERQVEKARSYLKKALRTDPHNRSLWAEVERDFRRLERVF